MTRALEKYVDKSVMKDTYSGDQTLDINNTKLLALAGPESSNLSCVVSQQNIRGQT